MRRTIMTWMSFSVLMFASSNYQQPALARQQKADPQSNTNGTKQMLTGNWLAVLDAGMMKLRMGLKVKQEGNGKMSAKLDSLDQGANDLPVDTITLEGSTVRFEAKQMGLTYEGTLSKDGMEIDGHFKQGPATLPLLFKRTDKAATLNRPQEPQKPYPYDEEEVVYENKKEGVKLAGTLTLPRGKGPFPAALLITGSGGQDRNETVMGHRPFLVLADHLTRQGIAVLRVDDRGIGGSSAGDPKSTSENYAGDVLAGVEFLKNRKEIDPGKIGLVGHSEGGMIAPMAAAQSKDVAYVVSMAGLGMIGAEGILLQNETLFKAEGLSADTIAQARRAFEKIFSILAAEKDGATAERLIREAVSKQVAAMTPQQRLDFAPVQSIIDAQTSTLYITPWFRYLLTYNPRPVLMKVRVPVLAINGTRDLQVAHEEHLGGIASALKAGGNNNYTIIAFPDLNHLFQTSKTGMVSEYSQIEETIAPVVLKSISDWILKQTTKPK